MPLPHKQSEYPTISTPQETILTKIEVILRQRPALVHRALARLVDGGREARDGVLVALADLDAGRALRETTARRGLDLEQDTGPAAEHGDAGGVELDGEDGRVRDGEGLEAVVRSALLVGDEDQLRSCAVVRRESTEDGTRGKPEGRRSVCVYDVSLLV